MLAEADAAGGDGGAVEAGQGADAGLVAVGSDDVAGGGRCAVGADGLRTVPAWLDVSIPARRSASGSGPEGEGAVEEELMEDGAA